MTSGPVAAADEADVVAAAVLDCPAVASLYGGGPVPVVTLLPGRRIDGVHLDEDRVRVAVVAAFGVPLIGMEEQVRAAVAPLVGGRPVDIHVADLQLPEEQPPVLPAGPVNHAGVLRDG